MGDYQQGHRNITLGTLEILHVIYFGWPFRPYPIPIYSFTLNGSYIFGLKKELRDVGGESKRHFPTFLQCLARTRRTHFGGCWHEKCGCQRSRRLKILATILRAVLWHCRTCNHLFPPTSQAVTGVTDPAGFSNSKLFCNGDTAFIASFERVRNKVMDRQHLINIWVILRGPPLNGELFPRQNRQWRHLSPTTMSGRCCSRTMRPNKNNNHRPGK